ncbi:MAG: TraC family protein [bacterium]|nr:TraC family protein [bacterium]
MANTSSTHQLIETKEIKDGLVVLKNGGLRAILMVSSINFALKSSEEQEAIIDRFQGFINSIDFPVQILVQSRKLDISEYLKFLNERIGIQTNELLKIQTSEYINFIQELIKLTNVMSKFFYVIIPLSTVAVLATGFFSKFFSKNKKGVQDQKDLNFETQKNTIQQRVDQVTSLLSSMGLKAIPLEKEALIELLYTSYNPGSEVKQKNMEALIATGDEAKKSG